MARENPAQILSIETNDEPSEAISTHIPRNAKGRIRQGTRPNSRMYWWPRTAPVGTNWRAGCEKSQHSGRQHRSAKPHHGFKSGARNEPCRPTCTWWPHEANRVVLLGSRSAACSRPRWRARKRCAASSCSERWPHAHRRIPAARSASSRNSMRSMFRRRGRQSIHVSSCSMGQATSALSDAVLDFLQTLG